MIEMKGCYLLKKKDPLNGQIAKFLVDKNKTC